LISAVIIYTVLAVALVIINILINTGEIYIAQWHDQDEPSTSMVLPPCWAVA
jgi:hypothetical protein